MKYYLTMAEILGDVEKIPRHLLKLQMSLMLRLMSSVILFLSLILQILRSTHPNL